jgi:drug/metabolite transporter (DMT)-like permease
MDAVLLEPRADESPRTSRRRAKEGVPYTLDHTEYAMDFSDVNCEAGQMWLAVFVASGIALGLLFEVLHLHTGPAEGSTFLVPFFGYVAQGLVGGAWVLATGSLWRGRWTRKMVLFMVLSSLGNGLAQALDYLALSAAGVMLYTILHSSVTFFACLISVIVLRTRVTPVQWFACATVVCGLLLTAIPTPIEAQGSFAAGVACAFVGSLCLAASYPLAELVFRSAPSGAHPPTAEVCSFVGSLVNVLLFLVWTVAYTVPRWEELVVEPVKHARFPSRGWLVCIMYAAYALMVGLHSLAFWKTMNTLGTIPTAISKGIQQAGTFLLAHVLFCSVDATECLTNNTHSGAGPSSAWSQAQKPVSFVLCCLGCLVYALVKKRVRVRSGGGGGRSTVRGVAEDAECGHTAPLPPQPPQ